jgi:hypothetical protein
VAAPEPTPEAGQGPEPRDVWQRRSPPKQGGMVQSCRTRTHTLPFVLT